MRFPTMFRRWKGAGNPGLTVLGADVVPVDASSVQIPPNEQKLDNVMSSRFVSINGWPTHRIALVYKYIGGGGAIALPTTMWFWEEQTRRWYQIGASQNVTVDRVFFFDVVALLDRSKAGPDASSLESLEGSISQLVLATDPGAAPDGEHQFAVAPDLTTTP
ncbi:MAG: hypothetical protein PVSMB8_00040 [Vulcanimicrobiaceae bacterium]